MCSKNLDTKNEDEALVVVRAFADRSFVDVPRLSLHYR
jgi:hypothetical protein